MRSMPPTESQGEVPVKARALTSAAGGAVGLTGRVLVAGVPLTWDSAWASSTTTAPGPEAAAADRLEVPVGTERPLSSCRLTPSATAFAVLPLTSVDPLATVIVDSRGVPARRVMV